MVPAVEVRDLSVFYGRNVALKSVNLTVQQESTWELSVQTVEVNPHC